MLTCSFCGAAISSNQEVFGFGAKAKPDAAIESHRGSGIEIIVTSVKCAVTAFIPGQDSPAAREGYDLYFVTCTESCAKALKSALDEDIQRGASSVLANKPLQPTRAALPIGQRAPSEVARAAERQRYG